MDLSPRAYHRTPEMQLREGSLVADRGRHNICLLYTSLVGHVLKFHGFARHVVGFLLVGEGHVAPFADGADAAVLVRPRVAALLLLGLCGICLLYTSSAAVLFQHPDAIHL